MKTRINNLKCVVPVLLTVLIVFCPFTTVHANIIPVSDRTPQVRDAIVAAIPDVSSADEVTNVHLATITRLNLRAAGISKLKRGDFSGLTALRTLNLYNNELSSLPKGIFEGLTVLTTLRLGKNAIDPLPLIVTLRQVREGIFQAVILTGAPFDIVLPINVTNGSISNSATMITISKGSIKSDTFTVVPMTDTSTPPIVRIGALPRLPANHYGYTFARSTACTRTLQVQEAITAAVPGITDCRDVTDEQLKTIQTLDLRNRGITTLRAEDFLGLPSLKSLYLSGNQLTSLPTDVFSELSNLESLHLHQNRLNNLPADIFSGLSSLTHLYLHNNQLTELNADVFSELPSLAYLLLNNNRLTSLSPNVFRGLSTPTLLFLYSNTTNPLSLTVSLEKVGEDRFKVTVPAGAPFDITLSLSVTNGNIIGSAENITIAAGNVESNPFTVTRTPGTLDSVTMDIKILSSLPTFHLGYAVVTSEDLPLEVLPSLNSPPIFTDGAITTRTVAENTGTNANIGAAIAATDRQKDKLTYTLGGTDAAAFAIDSTTGQLKTRTALDYETKNSYAVTLTVSDGKSTDTISVTIRVSDVNEAPLFTDGNSTTREIAENTTTGKNIGAAITATDPDDNTLTYSLGGTDASAFALNPKTGQLKTKAALDYERKKTWTVTLTVSDGKLTDTITVTINVTDVAERTTKQGTEVETTPNNAPVFTEGSSTSRSVAENTGSGVDIGRAVSATDADGNTLTYSLSGTDASAFSIDSTTGQLRTNAALDYETKSIYTVSVAVFDGEITTIIAVTMNITDVDESPNQVIEVKGVSANNAPMFTEGSSTTRAVAENTGSGVDIGSAVSATDPDNDTLTYRLGGTDAAAFTIDSTTGQLRTHTALDYETKSSYTVTITAADSTDEATITVTINVIDVTENRTPVFTEGSSTTRAVPENAGSGVDIGTAVSATDPDGGTLTYTLSGTDAAAFSIDNTTGQLRTSTALDYETKKNYTVTLTVSDGKLTDTITVTINITDVAERAAKQVTEVKTTPNTPPVFTEGSTTTLTVPENTPSGVDIGAAVSATDADGDTLTYTFSGTDANAFSIDKATGQLRTNGTLDYETKNSYTVTITVSDGSLTDSITVTVHVTDVSDTNSAPVFTEGTSTTRSVAENATDGTKVGSPVSATDPDNGDLNYTLSGTDSAAFYIVSTTGQLQTSAALDYETKNTYTVTVSVTDSGGESSSITVTINIIDITAPNYPLYGRTQQVQDAISDGYPADSVTAARLADINWLEIEDKGISALKTGDFAGLTALRTLNLGRNSISNISPLRNLTTLKSLSLYENSISNISPLANLTRLTFLNASDNSISNISALRNLTKLTNLGLSNNSISDITAVGNLTALTELSLWNNSIDDISALKNLTALTSLYLSHNSIDDISAVGNLTKLTILDLSHNSLSDISAVGKLTKLDYLSLGHNSLSDISAVGKLTALTKLGLYNNSLSDISAVGKLTTLIWLDMSDNSITDVSAVENLTKLGALFLRGNPIPDYGPLRRLKAANPGISIDIDINNNPPVFSNGDSTTRSIAENSPAGTDIGSMVSATDSDTNDTLNYTLGGTDAESFDIVSTSGQLQTKASLDYETKSSYSVTIDVSDGNDGLDRITVTINVTDVANAAPSAETPPAPPRTTALLSNYPNPFNPETWIPFQLATPSEVTITIYDIRGHIVRQLKLGHQAAGTYRSRSRAAHWDGHNHLGEKVATGVYFYRFTAGDFSATRKMLVRK